MQLCREAERVLQVPLQGDLYDRVVADVVRRWDQLLAMRMKPNRFGCAFVRDTMPFTVFSRMFWRLLVRDGHEPQFIQRHYGRQDSPTFSYTLRGPVGNVQDLVSLFGPTLLADRPWTDGGVYNADPNAGPLSGGIMRISQDNPMIIKVRFWPACSLLILFGCLCSRFHNRQPRLTYRSVVFIVSGGRSRAYGLLQVRRFAMDI